MSAAHSAIVFFLGKRLGLRLNISSSLEADWRRDETRGQKIFLTANAVQRLSFLLNELGTNAVKFGALANAEVESLSAGSLTARGSIDDFICRGEKPVAQSSWHHKQSDLALRLLANCRNTISTRKSPSNTFLMACTGLWICQQTAL